MDVVEDESKLVRMLHGVQTWMVLCHQRRSKAAHAGGVQYFTHLERVNEEKRKNVMKKLSVMLLGCVALKQSTHHEMIACGPLNERRVAIQSSRINLNSSEKL